ncbi:MAG: hypothetical protein H0U60_13810 [Blastocatellia bacterium]|nr:hypothetical protein [Blastocatellia bacterium]
MRAGRRGGKTTIAAVLASENLLRNRRTLYAAPTQDQLESFWAACKKYLGELIDAHILYKNETEHILQLPNGARVRGKTAWNADTLRGDYADFLILDEWQLMDEEAWGVVGAPMLLDNDGDAMFIYTPPSLRSRSVSKAHDKMHAAKLFKRAQADRSGRWQTFYFSSHDNPYISKEGLRDITQDMTRLAYEQEILAEDKEDNPNALWQRDDIEINRVTRFPTLEKIVVGVDPTNTSTGDEAGIVVDGMAHVGNYKHLYLLADDSLQGSPKAWGSAAVAAYHKWQANYIVAEVNNGGEMVAAVIHGIDPDAPVKMVHASRGKQTRAEPISALYEKGIDNDAPPRGHHVGTFQLLEDELCQWTPGDDSPNRLDAHVWAATELMLGKENTLERAVDNPLAEYRG